MLITPASDRKNGEVMHRKTAHRI